MKITASLHAIIVLLLSLGSAYAADQVEVDASGVRINDELIVSDNVEVHGELETSQGLHVNTSESKLLWSSGNGVIEWQNNFYIRPTGKNALFIDANGNSQFYNDLAVGGNFISDRATIIGSKGILTLKDEDSSDGEAESWVEFKDQNDTRIGIIGNSSPSDNYLTYVSDDQTNGGHAFYTKGPSSWLQRFRIDADGVVNIYTDAGATLLGLAGKENYFSFKNDGATYFRTFDGTSYQNKGKWTSEGLKSYGDICADYTVSVGQDLPNGAETKSLWVANSYYTGIHLVTHGHQRAHGLIFNGYLVEGASDNLFSSGNVKSHSVGSYGAGTGALVYDANGGTFIFRSSTEGVNNNEDVTWNDQVTISRVGTIRSPKIISSEIMAESGATINEISTDSTFSGNSNSAVPTEKAVKTYVDGKTSGGLNNGFSGRKAGGLTLNTSYKVIKYDLTDINDANAYDANTGVWTCPVDGRYYVSAAVCCDPGAGNDQIKILIRRNTSIQRMSEIERNSSGSAEITAMTQGYFSLSQGDTITIEARITSGSASISASHYKNYLNIVQHSGTP